MRTPSIPPRWLLSPPDSPNIGSSGVQDTAEVAEPLPSQGIPPLSEVPSPTSRLLHSRGATTNVKRSWLRRLLVMESQSQGLQRQTEVGWINLSKPIKNTPHGRVCEGQIYSLLCHMAVYLGPFCRSSRKFFVLNMFTVCVFCCVFLPRSAGMPTVAVRSLRRRCVVTFAR